MSAGVQFFKIGTQFFGGSATFQRGCAILTEVWIRKFSKVQKFSKSKVWLKNGASAWKSGGTAKFHIWLSKYKNHLKF